MPGYDIKHFITSLWASWFTRMSGPLSVPFAFAALYFSDTWTKIAFAFMTFICVWIAAYGVWLQEHVARLQAESRLNLHGLILSFHNVKGVTSSTGGKLHCLIFLSVKNQ